jgi:hypothetical protein
LPTPAEIRSKYDVDETDVSKLRILKQQAIHDLDYEKSKCIQVLINSYTITNSDGLIASFKDWLQDVLGRTLLRLQENVTALTGRKAAQETVFKIDIEKVIHAMKSKHCTTLTRIEYDRAEEIARVENRSTADYQNAVATTRALAADDQPDLAISLLEEAAERLVQDRESQRAAVDEKYDRLVRNEIAKEQTEFATLRDNFDSHMNLIQLGYENDVRTEHRKTTIFIQRTLLKGINDCCAGLRAKKYRPRVTEELTKYVKDFLDNQEKGFLLVVE